ncbi:hypothetical protein [Teredinibacter waterburyi]|uniref:hypothetical protein n=1 Tax=Teredinibacter waterburyi TaxID=1500538 RepID=UPI00165FBDF9|nr:hypothetical protein [Teredinibacter waterburyi]
MKNRFTVIFIVVLICSPAIADKSALVGKWKSNEEKSLKSMGDVEAMPDDVRKFMEKDFFGHLIAEYKETEARIYFDKKDLNTEESYKFSPYSLVREDEEYFLIKYFDKAENTDVTRKLKRTGNCYYLEVVEWGFNEYFCKIEEPL